MTYAHNFYFKNLIQPLLRQTKDRIVCVQTRCCADEVTYLYVPRARKWPAEC